MKTSGKIVGRRYIKIQIRLHKCFGSKHGHTLAILHQIRRFQKMVLKTINFFILMKIKSSFSSLSCNIQIHNNLEVMEGQSSDGQFQFWVGYNKSIEVNTVEKSGDFNFILIQFFSYKCNNFFSFSNYHMVHHSSNFAI